MTTYPNFIIEYAKLFWNDCEDIIEKSNREKNRLLALPPFLQTLELNRIMTTSHHEFSPRHYDFLTCVFLPIVEFIQEYNIYVPLASVLNFYKEIIQNKTYRKQLKVKMGDVNCCHNSINNHDVEGKGPCELCKRRYVSAMRYLENRVKQSKVSETKSIEVKDNTITRHILALENKYQELHDYVSIMENRTNVKNKKANEYLMFKVLAVICILLGIYCCYKLPVYPTSSELVIR